MFLHVSVILSTGGMSRSRPRGEVGGSGWGGCLGPDPGERLGVSGWGCVPRPIPRGEVGGLTSGGPGACLGEGCPGPGLGVLGVYPSMH